MIGSILERARVERGLSLEQAEQTTKIRRNFLRGLERDDHSKLPELVYVRGFVKTYARFLGLDGEALVASLRNDVTPPPGKKRIWGKL